MKVSEVARLSNDALRFGLKELAAEDRTTTVRLLIHVAEFESRRLYREEGYDSMHTYCVSELRMSADVAYKRVRVARNARRFPSVYTGIADGSLTLTGVAMLSPYLTEAGAAELLSLAAGKTNAELGILLAERFPQPDVTTLIQRIAPPVQAPSLSMAERMTAAAICKELAVRPNHVAAEPTPRPPIAPLSPGRFVLRITISQALRDKLEQAKNLLSHGAATASEEEVLGRALDALIGKLERRRYGATDRPRDAVSQKGDGRYIRMQVRRAVRERDGDRCTFVAENGRRCESRRCLEFDHVEPVGRGGKSTIDNLRLRCRAHNQLEGERIYGARLMEAKREEAQQAAAKRRIDEVIPWLQALGIRGDHARQAAESCDAPDQTLEDRVKRALSCFAPPDVALRRAQPVVGTSVEMGHHG